MRFLSFRDKDARTNYADKNKSREEFEAAPVIGGVSPKKGGKKAGLQRAIDDAMDSIEKPARSFRR